MTGGLIVFLGILNVVLFGPLIMMVDPFWGWATVVSGIFGVAMVAYGELS